MSVICAALALVGPDLSPAIDLHLVVWVWMEQTMEEDTPDSPPADGDVGTTPARPTLQLDKKAEQGFCVFYRGMPKVRRPERRAPRPVTRESGQGSGH